MPRGGYQKPSAPAPVSGPGALSKRTDSGPGAMQGAKYIAGLPYGQGQEFQDMQTMAPMEAAPAIPSASSVGSAPAQLQAMQPPVPLSAPTQRPNEPVTTGIAEGPGAGPEVMPFDATAQTQYESAQQMFNQMASAPGASPALQALARRLQQAF